MEKYTYVLASDLDGTLLSRGDTVSAENERAIHELTERGVCFAICSGRTISEMPRAVLDNPDIRYYIGADGAVIWDKLTGERTEFCMEREKLLPVFDLLDEYGALPSVRNNGIAYVDVNKNTKENFEKCRLSKLYGEFIEYYSKMIPDFDSFVRTLDNVEMICAFFPDDKGLVECRSRIEALGDFSIASSEPTNIEIFHKTAGKGSALLALADKLGVPRERTVAVGDSKNDMDMIKKAGLSLAMGNATDDLKAVADRTICRCEEHSIKYIAENILL